LPAGVAAAGGVHRLLVRFVAGVADFQIAKAREHVAVARIARGHHAVKHVDAGAHALDQVFRRAHAHQVAWLGSRQSVRRVRHDALHFFLGLADADAANGVTGQIELDQRVQRLLPQVLEHAALHDAKQRIRVFEPAKFGNATAGPAQAELH